MRRKRPAIRLAPIFLFCPGFAVLAGQDAPGTSRPPQKMQIETRIEKEYTVTLEAESPKDYCHAKAEFEWWQSNTVAHVEGSISNADCGASGGTYSVSVRYKDGQDGIHRDDHEENWSRGDDQPYKFVHDYEIGENVDLIRVSARKVVCICAEAPDRGDQSATKGENDE
jgi:hypothetical protein